MSPSSPQPAMPRALSVSPPLLSFPLQFPISPAPLRRHPMNALPLRRRDPKSPSLPAPSSFPSIAHAAAAQPSAVGHSPAAVTPFPSRILLLELTPGSTELGHALWAWKVESVGLEGQPGFGQVAFEAAGFSAHAQLMQMTMMVPPSFPKELHYLNKEDRLLRWLVVKHRGVKYGIEFLSEEEGQSVLRFPSGNLTAGDDDEDDDDEDDDEDEEEHGDEQGRVVS
ncbi:hypothetical protein Taro_053229 [Colocasia esculenta]|uniref:Uncharacterized protein n=1 Tax=Colocasia esculenta TaxID=4460 RepID=A0A843XMF8_COLES|nr:hypothetical protein [Colocasia esculenta]